MFYVKNYVKEENRRKYIKMDNLLLDGNWVKTLSL